jgi:acetate kinase
MYILTLSASHQKLDYAAFAASGQPLWCGHLTLNSPNLSVDEAIENALEAVRRSWSDSHLHRAPDAIGLRVVYGGESFVTPTVATDEALARLEKLAPRAPLHLPPTLAVAHGLRRRFANVPLVLLFETAFFANLPWREQSYGLDPDLADATSLRRYGYHGLFHAAACAALARQLRAKRNVRQTRVQSLCLEPYPELVSVDDGRPLVVTSGATPLEGLPGDTSAGEVDPAIVLDLAKTAKLGPEAINQLLTRESGLTGLVGHVTTLEEVIGRNDPEDRFALELFEHRLLLAAGAGIAALGGLDGVVISGRYASSCSSIGSRLVERLSALPGLRKLPPELLIFPVRRDRLMADETIAVAAITRTQSPHSFRRTTSCMT